MLGCKKLSTKKYTSRPSPPYGANDCPDQILQGNDGQWYKSVPDARGVFRWKLLFGYAEFAKKTNSSGSKTSRSKNTSPENAGHERQRTGCSTLRKKECESSKHCEWNVGRGCRAKQSTSPKSPKPKTDPKPEPKEEPKPKPKPQQTGFSNARGYYKTLGATPLTSLTDLKRLYRQLALQHHPDKQMNASKRQLATEKMQKINEAYQFLTSSNKFSYDQGMYR